MVNLDIFSEEIPKKSVEDVAWFLLASYGKMQEERDKEGGKSLIKRELGLDEIGNS